MEITLDDGYYVLKQNVKNPNKDGRSKEPLALPELKAGMRLHVRTVRNKPTEDLKFSYKVMRAWPSYSQLTDEQVAVVQPLVEPAPDTIGQRLDARNYSPDYVLAMLLDQGKITFDDVDQAMTALDAFGDDDTAYNGMLRKHWL